MADQDFNIKVVTTADTTGIRQTSAELDKLKQQQSTFAATQARILEANRASAIARDKPPPIPTGATDESGGIPAAALRVYAAEVAAAGIILNAIRESQKEQAKLFEDLDKESDKLMELGREWNNIASATRTEADTIKLVEASNSKLEQSQRKLLEIQKQQLSFSQAGIQGAAQYLNLLSHIAGLPSLFDSTMYSKGLDQAKNAMAELNAMAEDNAAFAYQTSKALEETWEADKLRPYSDTIAEIQRRISNMRSLQGELNTKTAEGRILWAQYGKEIDVDTQHMKELLNLQKQSDALAEKRLREQQSFLQNAVSTAQPQVQRTLQNEEAARKAREAGQDRQADLFQKTADRLKDSMSQSQREEYEGLTKPVRLGPKAGPGESQEAIDQIARNKINFDRQLKGEPPLPPQSGQGGAGGNQDIIDAMHQIWGY